MKRGITSINFKFMELEPHELLDLISKYASGIEIYIEQESQLEISYFDKVLDLAPSYGLDVLIHGDSTLSLEVQKKYLEYLGTKTYRSLPLEFTLHPVYNPDKEESIRISKEYFSELRETAKKNNIRLSIENLNDSDGMARLKLNDVIKIVKDFDDVGITYDIGHVIADGKEDLLSDAEPIKEKIVKLHIHTTKEEDHAPIYEGDKNIERIAEAMDYFRNIDNKFVFEYDVYVCRGETLREKVEDYLKTFSNFTW